jgi:succinate dehydrogenase / fumarate reductase cytochrome b subunit
MSAAAIAPGKLEGAVRLWSSTIGKKVVMALSGVVLFGFVIGHLLGNLQIYQGPDKINAYGAFLHHNTGLLWGFRVVLLTCVLLHIVASAQLTIRNWKARPVGYKKRKAVGSSYASRTMFWSGPIIAAFVVYHLLHFTFGSAHPDFRELNGVPEVYHNVITGFQSVPVALAYVVAMAMLGFHLLHGIWSMFQSVGVAHPFYTPLIKRFALLATTLIVLGNISIPIAVLTGIVH